MLQDQFRSVFSSPLTNSELENHSKFNPPVFDPIQPFQITKQHVIEAIDEIKANSSCTCYDIPAVVLKQCKYALCEPIKLFIEKSFLYGEIPLKYKFQTIIPLHKKGPKTVPENFRPISLTSHVIKIMERVIRKFLINHLERNNLINLYQHGFRENRSCCTQLISHINHILMSFIEGSEVDCVYLDYSKAFDKVDHGLLLKKMEIYGITGGYLKWVKNFLEDRSQTVFLNNSYSYPTAVISGVPQGSVLGPILFLIFINDLPNSICSSVPHLLSFADDTKIASKISTVGDKFVLQDNLNNIFKWSISNNMCLNDKKFELLSHKLYPDTPNQKFLKELPFYNTLLTYNVSKDNLLFPSDSVRDLGVYIDSRLNWNIHYSVITTKAKQLCAWALNSFCSRNRQTMLILFKSLIRPKLEYCCEVWNPHLIKDINCIEQIQRSFTSKIDGLRDLDYWQRLKILGLKSLQRRREVIILTHIWKIKNGIYPNSFDLTFKIYKRTNAHKAVLKKCPEWEQNY